MGDTERRSEEREMSSSADWPLAGLRVMDLSTEIAGPYCAKMLVDGGADGPRLSRRGAIQPAPVRGRRSPGSAADLNHIHAAILSCDKNSDS